MPVSFSRVREIAVISDDTIVSTKAIRPGTNRFELRRVGLKRMRTAGVMRTARACAACSCSNAWTTADAYACTMLPVFGSVASATISRLAGTPRPARSAKSGSKTIAPCASPRRNSGSIASIVGLTFTISKTPAASSRARSASVIVSGEGSTTAIRTRSTSVRIA